MSSGASISARLTVLALLSATTFYCFYKSRRLRRLKFSSPNPNPGPNPTPTARRPKLFFVSQTGTSKALADRLFHLLASNGVAFDLVDPKDYEPEDLHLETLVLIVASTWEDGKPPPNGGFFADWLAESADDFRVGSLLLNQCKFAVFGVGSRSYGETFNSVARGFSKRMRALGATEILPICEGDVDGGDLDEAFDAWSGKLIGVLKHVSSDNGAHIDSCVASESDTGIIDGSDEDDNEENALESGVVDLEDIAGKGPSRKSNAVVQPNGKLNGEKEMVTPVIRASLEKQVFNSSFSLTPQFPIRRMANGMFN